MLTKLTLSSLLLRAILDLPVGPGYSAKVSRARFEQALLRFGAMALFLFQGEACDYQ
jgi:hypothetical protein